MTRCLVLIVALAGCTHYVDPHPHPAVTPKLSTLPDDKRAATLDASHARREPEQTSRDRTPTAQKVETAAAFAAAILGDAHSHSKNVTLGVGTSFDETGNLHGGAKAPAPPAGQLVFDPNAGEDVPWNPVPPPATTDPAPISEPAH
ncbi:MAG TPA: hypothetical protein VGM90_15865 [Kofleriaceae bacterium]